MDARRKMSACFMNAAQPLEKKLIHSVRTEPIRRRIYHVKQFINFKGRKNKIDVNRFTKSNDELTVPWISLLHFLICFRFCFFLVVFFFQSELSCSAGYLKLENFMLYACFGFIKSSGNTFRHYHFHKKAVPLRHIEVHGTILFSKCG